MGWEDRHPLDGAKLWTPLGPDWLERMSVEEQAEIDHAKIRREARRRFYIFAAFVAGWTALALWLHWHWAGLATSLLGLVLDIGGGIGLAFGVLKVEEQPVGSATRYHDRWGTCRTRGFATDEGKQRARRKAIFRNGRYVIAGFMLQSLGTILAYAM